MTKVENLLKTLVSPTDKLVVTFKVPSRLCVAGFALFSLCGCRDCLSFPACPCAVDNVQALMTSAKSDDLVKVCAFRARPGPDLPAHRVSVGIVCSDHDAARSAQIRDPGRH